jgi:hypothetical protein
MHKFTRSIFGINILLYVAYTLLAYLPLIPLVRGYSSMLFIPHVLILLILGCIQAAKGEVSKAGQYVGALVLILALNFFILPMTVPLIYSLTGIIR